MTRQEPVRTTRRPSPAQRSAERERELKAPRFPLMEKILERPYQEYAEAWRRRQAA